MKKLLFMISFALICSGTHLLGQVEKGNYLIGGTSAINYSKADGQQGVFGFGLQPNWGIFATDRLVVGGELGFSISTSSDFTSTVFGIGPFGRYYFKIGEKNVWLFGNAGFNYNVNSLNNDLFDFSTNAFTFFVGPGIDYFITPSVAVEGLLNFSTVSLSGDGGGPSTQSLVFSVGLQVFLQRNKSE